MLTTSKDANINYLAKIVKIESLTEVPDSMNLVYTIIEGVNIVINKAEVKINDVMVYFPAESAINNWYLSKYNLYADKELNHDHNNIGFFGKNGRVRSIKLRGMMSSGFLMPVFTIESIDYEIGDTFDTVDNNLLVYKYEQKEAEFKSDIKCKTTKNEIKTVEGQFNFHIDTVKMASIPFKIDPDGIVQISRKMHGVSGISSYVKCYKELDFRFKIVDRVNKLLNKFFIFKDKFLIDKTKYDYIYASRRIIKGDYSKIENLNIWALADQIVRPKLVKGMTCYYEITGFNINGKMLQKDYNYGSISPLTLGSVKYGKTFSIYVYRLTMTNEDGYVVEFTPKQVQEYCNVVGLTPVTELYYGKLIDILEKKEYIDNDYIIQQLTEKYLNKMTNDCIKQVPDEGIVVRFDSLRLSVCKLKSQAFLLKETKNLDQGIEILE